MRIAVFSDSHGETDNMAAAIRQWTPNIIIHLGDHIRDCQRLKKEFPQIPIKAVRGNCDFVSTEIESDYFNVGHIKIFITHGHRYDVKHNLDSLMNTAHFSKADIVLYGHTHIALYRRIGGIHVINPGYAGYGPKPSYARVVIDDNGAVECNIVDL